VVASTASIDDGVDNVDTPRLFMDPNMGMDDTDAYIVELLNSSGASESFGGCLFDVDDVFIVKLTLEDTFGSTEIVELGDKDE